MKAIVEAKHCRDSAELVKAEGEQGKSLFHFGEFSLIALATVLSLTAVANAKAAEIPS